ncbi:MAG: hypothetical protein ACLSA2_10085 [Candidatus Gastranaerophilaceae bacterium]
MIREGRLIDKRFCLRSRRRRQNRIFRNFLKEYYSTLKLEYPDKIVSNELEAIGEKIYMRNGFEILAQKENQDHYGKSAPGQRTPNACG